MIHFALVFFVLYIHHFFNSCKNLKIIKFYPIRKLPSEKTFWINICGLYIFFTCGIHLLFWLNFLNNQKNIITQNLTKKKYDVTIL